MSRALLTELFGTTRPNVLALSRRLGIARNTVQARLDRLHDDGVIAGYGPVVRPAGLGYGVLAFVTLQIAQGAGEQVVAGLGQIPEVLEVHKITGPNDLLCRLVTRSNEDLERVIERILALPGITRTSTNLALASPIEKLAVDAAAVAALAPAGD